MKCILLSFLFLALILISPSWVARVYTNAGLLSLDRVLLADPELSPGDGQALKASALYLLKRAQGFSGSPIARRALGQAALASGDDLLAVNVLQPLVAVYRSDALLYHDLLLALSRSGAWREITDLDEAQPAPMRTLFISERLPRLLQGFEVVRSCFFAKDPWKPWYVTSEAGALVFPSSATRYALGQYVLKVAQKSDGRQ